MAHKPSSVASIPLAALCICVSIVRFGWGFYAALSRNEIFFSGRPLCNFVIVFVSISHQSDTASLIIGCWLELPPPSSRVEHNFLQERAFERRIFSVLIEVEIFNHRAVENGMERRQKTVSVRILIKVNMLTTAPVTTLASDITTSPQNKYKTDIWLSNASQKK